VYHSANKSMATDYVIRDLSNGLLITARRRAIPSKFLFAAAIPCALALIVLLYSIHGPLLAVGIFLVATFGILLRLSAASALLLVTRNDFERRGPFGSHHSVSSADIRFLEYRPAPGGFGGRSGGLYGRLKFRSVCLLPLLDEFQTQEVIETIANRFPDMASQWSAPQQSGKEQKATFR
jgi:hypothetical protein